MTNGTPVTTEARKKVILEPVELVCSDATDNLSGSKAFFYGAERDHICVVFVKSYSPDFPAVPFCLQIWNVSQAAKLDLDRGTLKMSASGTAL